MKWFIYWSVACHPNKYVTVGKKRVLICSSSSQCLFPGHRLLKCVGYSINLSLYYILRLTGHRSTQISSAKWSTISIWWCYLLHSKISSIKPSHLQDGSHPLQLCLQVQQIITYNWELIIKIVHVIGWGEHMCILKFLWYRIWTCGASWHNAYHIQLIRMAVL